MATEHPHDDSQAWLDALAGRRPGGPGEADARALRKALLPLPGTPAAPDWQALVNRSATPAALPITPPSASGAPGSTQPLPPAANDPRWARRLGWAAAVAMATALAIVYVQPADESALRGGTNDPAANHAHWVVPDLALSSQQLARDLRQAGASVTLVEAGDSIRLEVSAPAASRDAVNARLAPLDTAVDSQGHLIVMVRRAP